RGRAALGLELTADYEHTLLRLLSGDVLLARIEPAAAREQMQRELESPNPNVALYRKFAGCDVWLLASGAPTPDWVTAHLAETTAPAPADAAPGETEIPEPPTAGAPRARAPEQTQDTMSEQEQAGAEAGRKPVARPRATPPETAEPGRCAFCDSLLPVSRAVRFCPFCGADQSQRPCGVCGEPLQADWAFCIACGEAVAVSDA
ncbi:MAG: zinc ribbon domain-containing protein, partial [Gemmatimonadetes bacterium]|nr:zinc ribbon domain-containing protein [Gemmatimonadota bacterium]